MWNILNQITGRRAEARFAASVEVRIWIEDRPVRAISEDISASGIKLRLISSYPFRLEERFKIEVMPRDDGKPITTMARIARVHGQSPGDMTVACEFEILDARDRARIRALTKVSPRQMDRRVAPRLASCISTRMWVLGSAVQAYSKDISSTGIRILITTACRFSAGENYRIEIDLPKEPDPIHAVGRVARIIQEADASDRWDIALQLVQLDEMDKEKIWQFIHRREGERRELDLV